MPEPKSIQGVSTSDVAFVGETTRGPEYAKLVTSWLEYQRWFGGYDYENTFLPHAVQGFFDNGGKRCFIARVTKTGASHAHNTVGNYECYAIGRGSWGKRVVIRVMKPSDPLTENDGCRIRVLYFANDPILPDESNEEEIAKFEDSAADVEDFDNVTHLESSRNVVKVINETSRFVRLWPNGAAAKPPEGFTLLSQDGNDASMPTTQVTLVNFKGRAESLLPAALSRLAPPPPDDLLGFATGLEAVARVDEVSLVIAPDDVRVDQVAQEIIRHCESLADRFAIVSVSAADRFRDAASIEVPQHSTYAGLYYPWIRILDPVENDYLSLPPAGHIAGIYARTDLERGVHKPPANEVVRDATDLEVQVTKEMQEILNPKGINCIRDFRPDGRGIRLWSARTTSSDPEWRYVNVRRLFLFLEESIEEGTQWVVFEPNDEPTWSSVRRSISNFLIRVWKSGALMGTTPEEAFFVKCDESTMTQEDIDNGRLVCYIGIAPARPTEFVVFRITQKTVESKA